MKLDKVTRKTDITEDKPKKKYMRLFPSKGSIFFSSDLCEDINLEAKDCFVVFWKKNEGKVTRVFIAKENDSESGFRLNVHLGKGTLQAYCSGIVRNLTESFKMDEGEKSIKLGIKPEPIKIKEYHGYVLYELVKL